MRRLDIFLILVLSSVLAAAACSRTSLRPTPQVSLPPTTTLIPLPQDTPAGRPDSSPEAGPSATATLTPTLTATLTTYIVQPGDTLETIGSRFEVTVDELAETNELANPNAISAGQIIIIPQQAVAETAVPTTDTPEPTATATPESGSESSNGEDLEPTGRLEMTHPRAMTVGDSGVITVEIIADPALAKIGEHEPHITGVVRLNASYEDGERAIYEQTVELFPLMSAELNAPAFEVFPSGGNNVRLPRVISTTLPAVWTWDIIADVPGQAQVITLNLYKEPVVATGIPVLTQSISRTIQVSAKSRWNQIVDGLAANVLVLLGTGGPLGLILGYLTYRASKENERLKRELADRKSRVTRPDRPKSG